MSIHGDGVPIVGCGKAWSKGMEAYSWASVLTENTKRLRHWLMSMIHKSSCRNDGSTLDTIWTEIVKSFEILYSGVFPAGHAKAGQFIAGGYRFIIFIIKGDLEWIANTLRLEHFGSLTPCFVCRCDCDDDSRPWTDVRATAGWIGTEWSSVEEWRDAHPDLHVLFTAPGVSALNLMPDFMHCKHLGSDQYFYGSALTLLVRNMLRGTIAENVEIVWQDISQAYGDLRVKNRIGALKASMFIGEGFPRLKAKAANTRAFGRPLLQVWDKHYDRANLQHRQIKLGLELSVRIESLLDVEPDGHKMRADTAAEFSKAINDFLSILTALGNHYHPAGEQLFNFTIKNHMLLHIGGMAVFLHPKVAWCYSGECFMQIVKRIAVSCVTGSSPTSASNKATRKFLAGMGFVVFGRDCWQ